jgi:signal transduction histidine kinase
MPEVSWLIVIVGALGNAIIGLVTYLRNTRSATNRWFGIFSFLFAVYLILNQLAITQSEDGLTLFWIRAVMIIAPPIVFSFFVLVNVFPRPEMNVKRKVFWGSLVATLIMILLDATPLVFRGVQPNTYQPTLGSLVFLFPLYNVFFLGWSAYLLIKKFRTSSGIEKTQLKYFLFGAVAMFSMILFTNVFLVVVLGISSLVVLVPLYTLVFVGLTSYAIVRFGLFDVRVIATEATVVVLWVVLFSKVFTAQSLTEAIIDGGVFIVVAVFGLLLVKSVRREVEQRKQLQILNKKLEDLDKQKDEFLNVASHELRAPMTAVKGYIDMTQNGDGGEIPVKAQELLGEAATESERMIRLVNNMLNVARIEEGRMVFEEGEVNLSEVVARVFKEFKFEADNKALKYTYVPTAGLRDRVTVDIDRVHEVVANLINNAIKYTDEGSVTVKLYNPDPSKIRFEVTDTGVGMNKDELGKLFQKFYRAESYIGKKMGTGLGLYISRLLVQKFGGQIGVNSVKDKGSTFWFELPVRV